MSGINISAGQELAMLVSEKVFDKKWPKDGYYYFYDRRGEFPSGWVCYRGGTMQERVNDLLPAYCTDIAAAWEVVKKMAADGWSWYISNDEVSFDRGTYATESYKFGGLFYEHGKTAEAICIAALKAMEDFHHE